jgi:hypothetical protein
MNKSKDTHKEKNKTITTQHCSVTQIKNFCKNKPTLMRVAFLSVAIMFCTMNMMAQNTGIGTTSPQSKLHVNGDFRIKNGVAVTTISADSMFTNASDTALPTQQAMKRAMGSAKRQPYKHCCF